MSRPACARVAIVSATNRRGSRTRRVADVLAHLYERSGRDAAIVDLVELPPSAFAPDGYEDARKPSELFASVEAILGVTALHVVVPEYNGAMPGIAKAWIDLLPNRDSVLGGRAVAFVGVAAGTWGGLRPVEQLMSVFTYRKAFNFPERVFIREAEDLIDDDGTILDHSLEARLSGQVARFLKFADHVAPLVTLFDRQPDPG